MESPMKPVLYFFVLGLAAMVSAQEWKPAGNRIMTRWAKDVHPDRVWTEYPRPQFVRRGGWR